MPLLQFVKNLPQMMILRLLFGRLKIAQSTQVNYALKTAAYIILHDDVNAKANFERLSEQEQKDFILWPIMNLWKNSDSIIEAKE